MKNYTNKEIKDKVREIFNVHPDIIKNKPDYVKFTLEDTSLNVKKLFSLCEFFDTENIDETTQKVNGGYCSTCSYEYTVLVFTVTPTLEESNERLYNKI